MCCDVDDVSVLESLKTSGLLTLTSQSVVTIVSAHIVMSFVFQTQCLKITQKVSFYNSASEVSGIYFRCKNSFFFQNSYFQGSYFLKIQIFLKFTFQFQFWHENSNGICFWNFSNTVLPYLMLIMMVMLVIMLVIDSTLLLIEWKCSSQRFPTSNTKRSGLGNSGR